MDNLPSHEPSGLSRRSAWTGSPRFRSTFTWLA